MRKSIDALQKTPATPYKTDRETSGLEISAEAIGAADTGSSVPALTQGLLRPQLYSDLPQLALLLEGAEKRSRQRFCDIAGATHSAVGTGGDGGGKTQQQCEHDAVKNKAEEIRLRLEEMQGAPEAAAYASQQSREQGQQQRGASTIYKFDGKRSNE